MKKNMGLIDRSLRIVLALIVVGLYFKGQISGLVAIILGVFAIMFILTSLVGNCPLYTVLKISTCKCKDKK
jgi:hypothetical protein